MSERDQNFTESEAAKLRKHLAALSRFGGHALRKKDLDALLQEATELISEALEIDLVKVLELLPDGNTMLLRAGVNWNPGVVGHATFGAHEHSPGGYALQTDQPVISPDVAMEERFEIPNLLLEHGVKSMVNVVIRGQGPAWGVLEVDARRHHEFNEDDISFLQNYANLLASAIERLEADSKLAEAAERRAILLRELQHRVKNMLANVRALAKRTQVSSADLDEFAVAFDARLGALARTQDLLTLGTESDIGIRELLCQELQAHGAQESERVVINGSELSLTSKVAQALGMAFHELATNAGKHGALGRKDGSIAVSWSLEPSSDGEELLIRWRETGVTIKHTPPRRGLGSETIEQGLPYMLGGTSAMTFHPDGLECVIRFPLPNKSTPR